MNISFNKNVLFVCLLMFGLTTWPSCSGKKTSPVVAGKTVVATNSWTAAFAEAAGADNVVVLAPVEMMHPSEYELRPGDIKRLMDADIIIFAGYETMTERLKKGLNIPSEKLLQINTDYSYASIEQSIMTIAKLLNAEDRAHRNLLEIKTTFEEGRKAVVEKKMFGKPVFVHRFQESIARELGLTPVGVFGPAAPEAAAIAEISNKEVFMILDNLHNPVGQPFREVLKNKPYRQLLNFPGSKNTKTLTDVIRYNISQITSD